MPSAASRPMTIRLRGFALVGMGPPPSGEGRKGRGETREPFLRLGSGQDDAIAVPCALHQAARAQAVGRAEVHPLRRRTLVRSDLFRLLAGHHRGGQAVKIVAAFEGVAHGGVARDFRRSAQFHRREVGGDQHVAGRGDEQGSEPLVAGDLLQVRARTGCAPGNRPGDAIVARECGP